MESILEKDINYLNFNKNISSILRENNVNKVYDLWQINKKTLKNIGMNKDDIKQIIIKLELHGLDLNKKITK